MKILFICKSRIYSGAESVVLNIMDLLDKEEYECVYASRDGQIRDFVEERGYHFYPLKSVSPMEIRKAVDVIEPDLLYANDYTAVCTAALAQRGRQAGRLPLIAHLHNNPVWLSKGTDPRNLAFTRALPYLDQVISVSDSIEQEYIHKNLLLGKNTVIGNIIDPERIIQEAEQGEKPADVQLTFMGRLTPEKNPLEFCKIVAEVRKSYPTIRARMLGAGKLEGLVRDFIRQNDLQNNIRMLGFKKNPYPYLQATRLLVMPSIYEGFGLAAAEAMTLGKPVICSGAGGLKDIVGEKCGAVCAGTEQYAAEILRLLQNPSLYQAKSKASAEKALRFGDREAYRRQIEEVLKKAAGKPSHGKAIGTDTVRPIETPVESQLETEAYTLPLTVLTTTYNRRDKLPVLYQSLCRQTNQNFQWLVMDDGSTDGTEEWLKQIEEERKKKSETRTKDGSEAFRFAFEYHKTKNGGKHRALNASHPYIKGKFLIIVDSDDFLTDDAVEIILDRWKHYQEDPDVAGITFRIREYGKAATVSGNNIDSVADFKNGKKEMGAAATENMTGSYAPVEGQAISEYRSDFASEMNKGMRGDHAETIRSDLFCGFDFPEYEGEKFAPEGAMWYLATKGHKIIYSDRAVYLYHYLPDGLTRSGRVLRIRNPKGQMWHALTFMGQDFNSKVQAKNALLYCTYARFAGIDYKESVLGLGEKQKRLVQGFWLPSFALYMLWKKEYGKF